MNIVRNDLPYRQPYTSVSSAVIWIHPVHCQYDTRKFVYVCWQHRNSKQSQIYS